MLGGAAAFGARQRREDGAAVRVSAYQKPGRRAARVHLLLASAPSFPAHSLPPNPPSSRRKSRFHDPSALESPSSTHRRTASTSPTSAANPRLPHHRLHASAASSSPPADGVARLNSFLRSQRAAVAELGSRGGPASISTKIVLSDTSKSVSSIVAAICYAWMLPARRTPRRRFRW
ncbi:hypothetical protein ABZP36_024870 [Zizania latifolia]